MKAKDAVKEIMEMEDGTERLGFEILEQDYFDSSVSYHDIGRDVLATIRDYPDSFDAIQEVIIAITGYGFGKLREKIEEHRDYYDSL